MKWEIISDANGNISMKTEHFVNPSWVGAEFTASTVPVPWRLIPTYDGFY